MEDGTYLRLTSDYGEWEYRASDRMLACDTDEDVARVMEIVLGILVDMEDFTTFRSFREYVENGGGGELTDEDRVNYDLWQERYREWNDVTRHEAVEMMDYITKKYAL
jgi:hypothetical protein